jgi:hypothetical protein
MSLGNATHWRGPLLGSDQAGGGLWEDLPIAGVTGSGGLILEQWIEAAAARVGAAATHWSLTQVGAAGTVTPSANFVTLGSAADNTGPSLQYGGTIATGAIYLTGVPGVCAAEFNIDRTGGAATTREMFVGFMTDGETHPVLAAGNIDVGNVADGVGFRFNASDTGTLIQWDSGVLRTVTGAPTVTIDGNAHTFGVRIVSNATPRDTVFWYLDGRLVFGFQLVTVAQFTSNMNPVIAHAQIGGGVSQNRVNRVLMGFNY